MVQRDRESHSSTTENLQHVLADLGLGPRRLMGDWIKEGRVSVNGETAFLSQRVDETAQIEVEGRHIHRRVASAPPRILVMNKTSGTIVSRNDPQRRRTVFDRLPKLRAGRWISVGRLDYNTTGLLLFSDNGNLVQALVHPKSNIDREYAVRVKGKLREDQIRRLKHGVRIEGKLQKFSDLQYYNGGNANHWYHVVLMEGRNREVYNLFKSVGLQVSRLKRVRFGPIVLPSNIPVGSSREMNLDDVKAICHWLDIDTQFVFSRRRTTRSEQRSLLIPYPGLTPPSE